VTVDFDLQGGEQVSDKLQKFSAALRGMPLVQAFREVLLWITGDAKRFAPVDTGRLRASITPEVKVAQVRGREVQGVVGSNVEYAPFQEFGTVFMKGKFYLKRAIEKNAHRLPDAIVRAIQSFMSR
jgi:HK97 gp10 family phage protein